MLHHFLQVIPRIPNQRPAAIRFENWKPPDRGPLLLRVDAATCNSDGSCGLGVVVRDYKGDVVFAHAIYGPFPLSVEALTILLGIKKAFEDGFAGFKVPSDFANVVSLLNSNFPVY